METGGFFDPEPVAIDLQAKDRWGAIDELIGDLLATDKIKPEHVEAITAAVKKRESAMSTGIGFGIGVPHASTDLVSKPVAALGRSANGIQFEALDRQPVKLVLLFLVPQGQFHSHLHSLAAIAKRLHRGFE